MKSLDVSEEAEVDKARGELYHVFESDRKVKLVL